MNNIPTITINDACKEYGWTYNQFWNHAKKCYNRLSSRGFKCDFKNGLIGLCTGYQFVRKFNLHNGDFVNIILNKSDIVRVKQIYSDYYYSDEGFSLTGRVCAL